MSRRIVAAVLLGALVTALPALPGPGLTPRAKAASCSGWSSHTEPPPTIRVFRHASGAVNTVDFKTYTKNVLSREWIASWTTESLRSGALAVKNYAWYQVLHWRGGTNADGECFDMRDDTWDQVYDPGKPTYSTAAAAVDATWRTLVHKNGAIFATYYNAGAVNEPCGANANGWKAYQWGTQACGLAGKTAKQIILTYYHPGVTVTGGGAQPTPSPTPSPSPTTAAPSPTPAASGTPGASTTPAPTAEPTPAPTAEPTPVPTPPLAAPPSNQQLPGGGQSTVEDAAAPPPPPPASPTPVVVAPQPTPEEAEEVDRAGQLRWAAALARLERLDGTWVAGGHGSAARRAAAVAAPSARRDPRLIAFGAFWDEAVSDLLAAVAGSRRTLASAPDGAPAVAKSAGRSR